MNFRKSFPEGKIDDDNIFSHVYTISTLSIHDYEKFSLRCFFSQILIQLIYVWDPNSIFLFHIELSIQSTSKGHFNLNVLRLCRMTTL